MRRLRWLIPPLVLLLGLALVQVGLATHTASAHAALAVDTTPTPDSNETAQSANGQTSQTSPSGAVLTGNSASIQYADGAWNWLTYSGSCCAAAGAAQVNFQCAEFVARALSAAGLVPGLSTTSSQSAYGSYSYNGHTYNLLNTGKSNIDGLYQFLVDNHLGRDIGDNPARAVPGDVVFYYDASGVRQHTTLLVATGTTAGGSGTLVDSHNYAALHHDYTDMGVWSGGTFYPYTRTIVHLNANSMPMSWAGANPNDGTIQVFALGSDNTIYRNNACGSCSGGWAGWTSTGATTFSGYPAIGRNFDGHLELFARGTDGLMYHSWQCSTCTGGWHDWTVTDGGSTLTFAGDPSIAINNDGRLEAFARGTDGKVYHQWQSSPNSTWTNWGALKTNTFSGDPKVINNDDGRLEVFVRGSDGHINHIYQCSTCSGGWSGWSALSTQVAAGNPAVGRNPDGRLEVFVRGTDSALYHIYQCGTCSGGWSNWSSLSGSIATDPTVAENADGHLEIFATAPASGPDQPTTLMHIYQCGGTCTNGWSGWGSLGGGTAGVAAVTLSQSGKLNLFAVGTDATMEYDLQVGPNGSWVGVTSLGGSFLP